MLLDKLVTKSFSAIIKLGLGYLGYLSVKELAGKDTFAGFFINYKSLDLDIITPIIIIILMLTLALCSFERNLKIKKMTKNIKDLEEKIDPKRTSSLLNPNGRN